MALFWQELTDMELMLDALNEMKKKYGDTILKVEHPEFKKPKYGQYYQADGIKAFFENNSGGFTIPIGDDRFKVTVPKVPVGCYTSTKVPSLLVLQYLPHRQWKKGLCKYNTNVVDPIQAMTHLGTQNVFNNVIYDILENTSLQEERTLTRATEILEEGMFRGICITRDFGVTLNYYGDDANIYMLFHNQFLIGRVLKKEKSILVENHIFFQEVIDTQKNWCPDYEVVKA